MKFEVSYHVIDNEWYVGRLYDEFFKYISQSTEHEFVYVSISELAKKYGYDDINYVKHLPSIFNIYNLIIRNTENNKTFIHSFHDYAPLMMEETTGILNFEVVKFCCNSNLTQTNFDIFSAKYLIQPTFGILENWSDYLLIDRFKKDTKTKDKIFFNGLCYGERGIYKYFLQDSDNFDFRDKQEKYQSKEEYYSELSEFKIGLSLNGAAIWSYRDLEYFGLGIINLRSNLNIKFYEPLVADFHYIDILDEEIKTTLYETKDKQKFSNLLNDKIHSKLNSLNLKEVVKNGLEWYERNCNPSNQIKILENFLENYEIFN
jgi:hypothetical protein